MQSLGKAEKTDGRRSTPVYVDGKYYHSLFQASIDLELSYFWFYYKVSKSDGPVVYAGHEAVLAEWVKKNPEYKYPQIKEEQK